MPNTNRVEDLGLRLDEAKGVKLRVEGSGLRVEA